MIVGEVVPFSPGADGAEVFVHCACTPANPPDLLPVVSLDGPAPVIVALACPACGAAVAVENGRLLLDEEAP